MSAFVLLVFFGATFTACSDDDDNSGRGPANPLPAERIDEVTVVFQGTTYQANFIEVDFSNSPQSLEITGTFPGGSTAEIGMVPIPPVGSHSTTLTLAFGMDIGQQVWFCNEGYTVEIQQHDTSARWIRLKVTGTVSDLFGQNTATLAEARFAVLY